MAHPMTMVCPACGGSKVDKLTERPCHWCHGARSVAADVANRYADFVSRLAVDWLDSGYHGLQSAEAMAAEAAVIRQTARRIAPQT